MSDELEKRITKVEWTLSVHGEEIKTLVASSKELKEKLGAIDNTLKQIKWIAVGAGLMYFAEQVGLSQVLKLLVV